MISEFVPLIKSIARRLNLRLPAHLDEEDLISAGIIGLMDAMTRYNPERGAKFKTYAEFRIRGAMLDEIRSMDWIPRSVRDRIAILQRVQRDLLNRYGRPPMAEELAAALTMSVEELADFLPRAQGAMLVSIEDLGAEELSEHKLLRVVTEAVSRDPLSNLMAENMREVLEEAIQQLPEKERSVLMLYYCDELTMSEIGSSLNVTESRVCQIHSQAITHLKAKLHAVKQELQRC